MHLGIGPFVAIQSSKDSPIEAFGLGALVGLRPDAKSSTSLNLGIGALLDPKVRVLGDGIVEGQPLPDGETEVRFRTEGRWRFLILASFSV
jgi:hypothetical protein